MKSLAQIREEFIKGLSSQYSPKEIDIIFYALAENYLHKDKSVLKLGVNELMEDSESKPLLFQNALFHLMSGMPYQYVLGFTEFYGCKILVNPEVLIPRPETEELVEWIIKDYQNKNEELTVIDLCSGSGCIAIALAKKLFRSVVSGIELNKNAVELARKNAEINQAEVKFIQADVVRPNEIIIETKPDIIVSNPPYIREFEKESVEDRVLKYEPSEALFVPDEEPLVFYEKIIDFARKNLEPSGKVYVEINQELGKETKELFLEYFNFVELKQDLSGNFRMIKAKGLLI
jgi:release factor glutamine methyltransferase